MFLLNLFVFLSAGIIVYFIIYVLNQLYIRMCKSTARVDGKVVIITGSNTGIGKTTAIDLAQRGAIIVLACRNSEKSNAALKDIKRSSGVNCVYLMQADLSSLKSVKKFVAEFLGKFSKLHILINNAGVMMCPYEKTENGFEKQLGTNHFGHFLLTNLLLKTMVQTGNSRIINVSSYGHWFGTMNFDDIHSEKHYISIKAYGRSKLANILFTKELHRKLIGTSVTAFAVHPGAVFTELGRYLPGILQFVLRPFVPCFTKTPTQGAQTQILCAVAEGLEKDSGKYFENCAVALSSKESKDEGVAKKLWDLSEVLTNCKFDI